MIPLHSPVRAVSMHDRGHDPDARRREGQRGEGLAAADGPDATLPQELGPTTADNGEQVALFTGAVPRTGGDRSPSKRVQRCTIRPPCRNGTFRG